MIRHGLSLPRAGALALRSTASAVLDAGNADLDVNLRALPSSGSDRIRVEIIEPALDKLRHTAATSALSGNLTAKSP